MRDDTVNVLDITVDDIANGIGIRSAVFLAGCRWQCQGCWSPQSWDFNAGKEMTIDEIAEKVCSNPLLEGLTLTGGDPFYNPEKALMIIKKVKEKRPDINVWCWTGFTFEALQKLNDSNIRKKLLQHCDIIVDGKFILAQRDLTLRWKGSANQRVIDVQKSLKENKVVISEYA